MKLFLQRLISVKPQNGNSLFIIYKGRVDAHKSFSSFQTAAKATGTRQGRYFGIPLWRGTLRRSAKNGGGFGGKSYEQTQEKRV